MGFTVIIPSKNADNVDRCVNSIREQDEGCRVIVIDDGLERHRDDCQYVQGIKPFVYSRAINQGIRASREDDVILLNDDTVLKTEQGLTSLRVAGADREYGIVSASIDGMVCNKRQQCSGSTAVRREHSMVAFICVYIRREVIERVGLLDERFVGYGVEDRDYCRRVLLAGYKIGIWDGCLIDHSDNERSSFRTKENFERIYQNNIDLFNEKWDIRQQPTKRRRVSTNRKVDLLFLARNRREFTEESFAALFENTDWRLVNKLYLFDDGSVDGTNEFLMRMGKNVAANGKADVDFIERNHGDPVGPMRDFLAMSKSYYVAKIDNDTMVPPGWLSTCVGVLEDNQELDLLGIEDHCRTCNPDMSVERTYADSQNIGGIGVFRAEAFSEEKPQVTAQYCGFWDWQNKRRDIKRGWLQPGIPVFLLDRVPFQPWAGFSKIYVERQWQRPWWNYTEADKRLWQWRYPGKQ